MHENDRRTVPHFADPGGLALPENVHGALA